MTHSTRTAPVQSFQLLVGPTEAADTVARELTGRSGSLERCGAVWLEGRRVGWLLQNTRLAEAYLDARCAQAHLSWFQIDGPIAPKAELRLLKGRPPYSLSFKLDAQPRSDLAWVARGLQAKPEFLQRLTDPRYGAGCPQPDTWSRAAHTSPEALGAVLADATWDAADQERWWALAREWSQRPTFDDGGLPSAIEALPLIEREAAWERHVHGVLTVLARALPPDAIDLPRLTRFTRDTGAQLAGVAADSLEPWLIFLHQAGPVAAWRQLGASFLLETPTPVSLAAFALLDPAMQATVLATQAGVLQSHALDYGVTLDGRLGAVMDAAPHWPGWLPLLEALRTHPGCSWEGVDPQLLLSKAQTLHLAQTLPVATNGARARL